MACYFNDATTISDAVGPALRVYGVRRAKEENEASSTRVRALTTGGGGREEEQGTDVKGDPRGRGRGRGRGGRGRRVDSFADAL